MGFKKIFSQLNIVSQCRRYKLPLWQCPQFLFLVMGLLIILSILAVYNLAIHYIDDPYIVILIILFLAAFLFVVSFSITQSFEKLAEASRMKSEFISIVSHQLRAPLSNLKWTTEFLASGRADSVQEKQAEYFTILKENTDRMEELVSDLLTVSRIQQGKLPLRKERISLSKIVNGLILEFSPLARASNVEISFEQESEIPEVLADPSQIKVVIENLLDNAIRYSFSREEKGQVKIRLARRNGDICLEVEDSGVGIPEGDKKYIFQKFFRAENILRYQTQGSGLGLFISKSIVERSGGKIGFNSKEGGGSAFWFTLPLKPLK